MKKNNQAKPTHNSLSKRTRPFQKSVVRDGSGKKADRIISLPLLIPNNIPLEDSLQMHPIDVPHARDKIVYLLYLIHAVPAFYKSDNSEMDNGYTFLLSTHLQSLVFEYAELFRWLVNRGIIEVDNGYIRGVKSKGYRFCPKYQTKVTKVHITSPTLISRIVKGQRLKSKNPNLYPENLYNVTSSELKRAHLGYKILAAERLYYLSKWLNEKLTIDIKRANEYLNDVLKVSGEKFPMRKYNCGIVLLESFANNIRNFSVDDTTGRAHTLLTRLYSPLRVFLRYDGKSLSAVDIKNSQPGLSLVFLDKKLYEKNKIRERIEMFNRGSINSTFYIMLEDLIEKNASNSDTILYKELVLTGKIYTWFGKKLQDLNILNKNITECERRGQAKHGLLKSLFNRNQAIGYEKIQCAFQKLFPSVYEIFSFIKRKNYKTLACVLQNFEAEIVLHKACFDLASIIPDSPLFPIHDSIASTTENVSLIADVLSKHLLDALEVTLELDVEHYDEKYLEKKNPKELLKTPNTSLSKELFTEVSQYGYSDDSALFITYLPSLSQTAKVLDLRKNKFLGALRMLKIINEFNLPTREFEVAKLLLPHEFPLRISRRNIITISSTKVTEQGFEFLKQLSEENPDLFPKKKFPKKGRKLNGGL